MFSKDQDYGVLNFIMFCGGVYLRKVEKVCFGATVCVIKVARYSFSGSIPPKFERKLRRYKQKFGKINTTVVLDKDENLL